ncbi:hypothetical protein ACE193_15750 [Bernardetia sp. OM2101]|uniref:hypothetical protein n=1 Tax=Bernardetia sp. OM2101 TaxID=3344876 RepID=UPI0035CF65D1
MKILEIFTPTHHFTHQTSLQTEKVKINLQNSLTPKNAKLPRFSVTNKRKSYEGEVLEEGFIISRRKKGSKNSFPPIAKGVIKESQFGSEIFVEIQHRIYVQIMILAFFILLMIDISIALLFWLTSVGTDFIYLTLFFGITFSFGFISNYYNSKEEVKDLNKDLILFIEGEKK